MADGSDPGTADEDEGAVPAAAREEVVESVRRALAKHGYADLTTAKVAAESEKSEAFFFYHYDTKDDLILAFVDWAADRLTRRLSDLDGEDPVVRLYAACEVLLGDYEDETSRGINVAMMELLSHAPHEPAFRERLERYERGVLDDLAGILRDGVDAGQFREVDPESTAAFLLMATDGTAGAVMALGMTDVDAGVREGLFDYLERSVLAPGVSPPEGYR
ncbi:TetR/AcrR family transcriptional regulator [Halobacteriales archaeon QS_8_69_26]|nr:MAG: TetR/AcrR family transcriptional regulator [Halobacteriales archaeon QS_8_69_26]